MFPLRGFVCPAVASRLGLALAPGAAEAPAPATEQARSAPGPLGCSHEAAPPSPRPARASGTRALRRDGYLRHRRDLKPALPRHLGAGNELALIAPQATRCGSGWAGTRLTHRGPAGPRCCRGRALAATGGQRRAPAGIQLASRVRRESRLLGERTGSRLQAGLRDCFRCGIPSRLHKRGVPRAAPTADRAQRAPASHRTRNDRASRSRTTATGRSDGRHG